MEDVFVPILIPLGVAVVMPCLIVWIVFRAQTNKDNKNAEIIIKAIENNQVKDTEKIIEALGKEHKTPKEILQSRLLRGCIFTFVGIAAILLVFCLAKAGLILLAQILAAVSLPIGLAYLIVYFATRKSVTEEDCVTEKDIEK